MPTQARPPHAESLLLGRYRRIEATTRQMLCAAREDDWRGVRRCESEIGEMARELEHAKGGARLSRLEERERLRIMRRLVEIDAEVRRLADPATSRFDLMFAPARAAAPVTGRQA